jgi:hypothetical protein
MGKHSGINRILGKGIEARYALTIFRQDEACGNIPGKVLAGLRLEISIERGRATRETLPVMTPGQGFNPEKSLIHV